MDGTNDKTLEVQKYISSRPLSEKELKKIYNDYIPMFSGDNSALMIDEYIWKMNHGFSERDYMYKAKSDKY